MRTIRASFKHIRRSPYQALAALMVISLTFSVVSVLVLILLGSEKVLNFFETRPQVTVFFEDSVTEEEIENLKETLQATGKIESSKYVSKEEALELYKEFNKEKPLLLEMVTAEILPASLEISSTDIQYLPEVAAILKKTEGIEEVIFEEEVVKKLTAWTTTMRKFGLGLALFLVAISILILIIILGMKMTSRRAEIKILRLLGASSWYTIGPFLWEGMIYGILGAILGWGAAYLALLYSTPLVISFFANIELLPVPWGLMLVLLGAEILMGAVIGTFSTLMAVRRYLK